MGEETQQDDKATGFWHTLPGVVTAVAALLTALGGFLGILIQYEVIGGGDDRQVAATPADGGALEPRDGDRPASRGSSPSAGVSESAPGSATERTSAGASESARGSAPESEEPSSQAAVAVPWERAMADLVRRDGSSTRVKASTVGLNCDTGKMKFENGQELSLELVRSIRYDAVYLDSASADGLVTLLDGRELTDPLYTWNCPIEGQNDLGRVQIELEDIRRIEFHR